MEKVLVQNREIEEIPKNSKWKINAELILKAFSHCPFLPKEYKLHKLFIIYHFYKFL
jgi:hypothetical protein